MDEQLKRRLIGATVLVSLAIIFLPMLLSHKPVARHTEKMASIPVEPPREFDASLLRDAPPEQKTADVEYQEASPEKTEPVAKPARVTTVPDKKSKPLIKAAPEKKPQKTRPETGLKKVPVKKKPVSLPSAWVVQVASFSSHASAEKLVKKLRKAGLDTMNPMAVTVNGKKFYRVQVGPELDKKRAQKLLPRINKLSGSKGQVVRYP